MPGAPFMRGFNNPQFHDEVIERTKRTIDECADAKFPSVIAFVGYKWKDAEDPKSGAITTDEAVANCVKGLKDVAGHAEKKGVTVCLEHLNTPRRHRPHEGPPRLPGRRPRLGRGHHPKVGSPRVKLLFDIYHVQVMHGDLIRRIEQTKDIIGHVHTAGVPGRGELDERQEINYPAVIKKLVEVGLRRLRRPGIHPDPRPAGRTPSGREVCDV